MVVELVDVVVVGIIFGFILTVLQINWLDALFAHAIPDSFPVYIKVFVNKSNL